MGVHVFFDLVAEMNLNFYFMGVHIFIVDHR